MALPGSPLVLYPEGVTDTLESTTSPRGSMTALVNLIPDPSAKHLWQCRPAATLVNNLETTLSAGSFVSVMMNIGTRIYGMIQSTAFPGRDQPFCYDVVSKQP